MPEWTQQQRSAIDARGRSIIVSAAAGSGKTAVLVERLLSILSDYRTPVQADRIIVVTFTNDAAAQMKQRLSSAMTSRLSQLDETQEEYTWLLEQRMRLSAAKISTIHSFCFDLIRENADELGVSPAFVIADEGQGSICQRHALDTVMERWTAEEPAMQLLYDHFCVKDDSDTEAMILAVVDYLESAAFPEKWLQDARNAAKQGDALFERMRRAAAEELRSLIALYEKGAEYADRVLSGNGENKFRSKAENDLAALRAQLSYLETESAETICNAPTARSCQFASFPTVRKNVDAGCKLAFQQLSSIVKTRYTEYFIPKMLEPLRYFHEDAEVTAKVIPALLDLTEEYLNVLREEKNARNLLTFSDAEELTLHLLAQVHPDGTLTRTPLAVQISEQYDLIMVDEYQDTNNKQDSIFKLLSHGMRIDEAGLHYGDNAFLVGDVKQSIYSFRQANPENFRRAIAESTPLAQEQDGMALIRLNQNFRSAAGVLDFVNALFFTVMSRDCGEVEYTAEEQLNFGSKTYAGFTDRTQILLALQSDELLPGMDLQAECAADTIASMIGRTPVVTMGENGILTTRPAEAEDFCILLRSVSRDGETFAEALRRRNIAASADTESGLLDLPEIHLVRCLLRIADNPMTDTAMGAVMLSPVGGFTAEDLARLMLCSKEGCLYRQMKEFSGQKEAQTEYPELWEKVQVFQHDVRQIKETAERYPLEEAIWEIYTLTDLMALQSMYEDAAQRRANLDAFARMAGEYRRNAALTPQSCLSGWLRYLDRLEAEGNTLEVRGGAVRSGCVQIKTIHKSKGLQYPFVFAAKLNKKFGGRSSDHPVQAGEDGLLGVRIFDRQKCIKSVTAAYSFLHSDVLRSQTSEELRLFYVALTRAEQQLFLILENPEGAKKDPASAGKLGTLLEDKPSLAHELASYAKCMQDWVLYFLLSCEDRFHMERLMDGEESSGRLADFRLWNYHFAQENLPEKAETVCEPDAQALDGLRRQLAFRYETAQSSLVSKYSVTELSEADADDPDLMQRPEFTLEGTTGGLANLKGAERGTAVHKVMQLIDFELAAKDPDAALQALFDSGRIFRSEYESVDRQQLAAFFASPIFHRIAASDRVERERKIFVMIGGLKNAEITELTVPYRDTDGVMIGTMDLLFHEPDGWVILDYKTDHASSAGKLLQKYRMQLLLYRAAAEQILGEPVKALYLYSFVLGQEISL